MNPSLLNRDVWSLNRRSWFSASSMLIMADSSRGNLAAFGCLDSCGQKNQQRLAAVKTGEQQTIETLLNEAGYFKPFLIEKTY